jgi:ribosomal protein L37AE/L43A
MTKNLLPIRDSRDIMHDCPKCAKQTLNQIEPGVFECIWCGFRKDISQRNGGPVAVIATAGGILLLIALL